MIDRQHDRAAAPANDQPLWTPDPDRTSDQGIEIDAGLDAQSIQVGRQHRVCNTRQAFDGAHDFGVIGYLRDPLRRHEGSRLDRFQAGLPQPGDQLHLGRGGDTIGLVLQAVAGTDLDDLDRIGQWH